MKLATVPLGKLPPRINPVDAAALTVAELPAQALGANRAINLPGVCVTAREMLAALERVAGPEAAKRVRWERDEATNRIVAGWPGAWPVAVRLASASAIRLKAETRFIKSLINGQNNLLREVMG